MDIRIKRLSEKEFASFAELIYKESGIYLKETKITLLSNRLRKRLQALKLDDFSDYYNYLQKLPPQAKRDEYEKMLDVVSTNETYFFRNERHFEALTAHCLPQIAKTKKEKHLRIWSAACSTGEEPYTLAICILENMNLFQGWNIEILATDIAPTVLEFAAVGEYSGRRIEKVPPALLKKYFIKLQGKEGVYRVKDELKKIVKLHYHNFFQSPFPGNIDIIFCRNVMIYFDRLHQKELVKKFYTTLNTDGFLFIGHSETLHSISDDFLYRKILDAPVYVPVSRVE